MNIPVGSQWFGGTVCDMCKMPIVGMLFDAATRMGPWATMCKVCWMNYSASPQLGTGHGQRYVWSQERQAFVKAEG